MTIKSRLSLPLARMVAAALSAAPADAQGNGRGHGNGNGNKGRAEQHDRRRDRDDDRWDDRRDDRRDSRVTRRDNGGWVLSGDRRTLSRNGRAVPRGWCQGRGNPHNTAANCGGYRYNTSRSIWEWIGLGGSGRYDPRYDDNRRSDSRTVYGSRSNTSYSASHSEFHRVHDARCRDRMNNADNWSQRVQVTSQCKAEHDDWHRRTGTRH
ncbi:hypothetical protein [Longimicrobium sp.]|uniref:hypothetical protein n=1 Tax=Longimicrobium sp. TaxID=2029185 RepID=UPI003B3B7F70